jgi:hypothetical protein
MELMVVRFPSMVFCLLLFLPLLSGCGGFIKKEASTSPRQEIINPSSIEKEPDPVQTVAFNNWCKYWLPFVSEYTGAVVEMEAINSQLAHKQNSTEIRTRIEEISLKLTKADNYLGQLPATDELSREHRDLLAQNAVKARSVLLSAKQIPMMLSTLAENPEDQKTKKALVKKFAEANEIFVYHKNVLKIRNDLLKTPR